MSLLIAEKITKTFPGSEKPVLKEISFSIEKGDIMGIVGPNGIGKTTLIKILSGLIIPDSGEIKIGQPQKIGLVTGNERSFYWRLNARENLRFFAKLAGLSRVEEKKQIDELSDIFSITDFLNSKVSSLSTGTCRRLAVIRALLNNPAIILIDDFPGGLDREGIKKIIQFLKNYCSENSRGMVITSTDEKSLEGLATKVFHLTGGCLE